MDKHNPIVSVCCLVYNHEPFLRECFEGFVMQQTTFPIEILVHDDASTDHSADIIREYTEKYFDLFKPIYQTENQYSKGNGFVGVSLNLERAKGKYIAMCEGDDYWTDPLKLQKQVDFLEANPDFSVCFHNSAERYGNDIVQPVVDNEKIECSDIYELAKGNVIYTASVLYRSNRNAIKDFLNFRNLPATDYVCHLLFAQFGKIAKLPQTMSVYRRGVGVWSQLSYSGMVYNDAILLLALMDYFRKNNDMYNILGYQLRGKIDSLYNRGICTLSRENQSLRHSKSYRLGYCLLQPLRILKSFF